MNTHAHRVFVGDIIKRSVSLENMKQILSLTVLSLFSPCALLVLSLCSPCALPVLSLVLSQRRPCIEGFEYQWPECRECGKSFRVEGALKTIRMSVSGCVYLALPCDRSATREGCLITGVCRPCNHRSVPSHKHRNFIFPAKP